MQTAPHLTQTDLVANLKQIKIHLLANQALNMTSLPEAQRSYCSFSKTI